MIRTLRDDEPIPGSKPARYIEGRGYVRLRWWVGPDEYVEQYEHRIVGGRPPSHLDVHHLDGDKANNDRANLVVLTKDAHTRLHAVLDELARPRVLRYSGYRCRRDEVRADRKLTQAREAAERMDRVLILYGQKMTTVQIGAEIEMHPSGVTRILRAAGVTTRRKADYHLRPLDPDDVVARYRAGQGATRIRRELGVDLKRVHAILQEAGVQLRGPGRVAEAATAGT